MFLCRGKAFLSLFLQQRLRSFHFEFDSNMMKLKILLLMYVLFSWEIHVSIKHWLSISAVSPVNSFASYSLRGLLGKSQTRKGWDLVVRNRLIFLRCQKLTTSAHVRGQSNKKQVYFTLCFGKFTKNWIQQKSTNSCYKPPSYFYNGTLLNFESRNFTCTLYICKNFWFSYSTQATQAVGVWRRVLWSHKSLSGNVNNIN